MLQFARQEWLWLLVLVPILGTLAWFDGKNRGKAWKRLGQPGQPRPAGSTLWIAASLCLVIALAEPRWGQISRDSPAIGDDLVLAIDLSRSMGAEDALPNRLGLAAEAAVSLIEALGLEGGSHRVAVVGFAGRGVLRCPLTENLGAAIDSVDALRIGQIEPSGTNLGAALDAALEALDDEGEHQGGSIVVFSDGEDHEETWRGRIETLKSRGVIVHAVAIGDADEGHVIPTSKSVEANSETKPLQYRGETVRSKRRDESLEALAASTGGALIRLGISTVDLGSLYQTRIEPVAVANRSFTASKRLPDRFDLFLLAAFTLILAANWRPRTRLVRRLSRLSWSMLLVFEIGAAPFVATVKETVDRGSVAYAGGRFEEARARFQEARRIEPMNPIVLFDEAAALFQLKRFGEAHSLYQAARSKAEPALRTKIDFALGNTAVALQDLGAAIGHYGDCIASTTAGDPLDRVRRDALLNKNYVEAQTRRSPSLAEAESKAKSSPPSAPPPSDQPDQEKPRPNEDSPPETPNGGGREPNRTRTTGGGGGSGEQPQPTTLGEQLARAVDNVRKAKGRRIDESVSTRSSVDRKDW